MTKLDLEDNLDNPDGFNLNSGRAIVTYQYDDLHRLTREYCSPGNNSYRREYGYEYSYDAVGNRTKMRFYNVYHDQVYNEETEEWEYVPGWETTTYQYSSRNELTKTHEDASDTTTTFEYDLRGNLTKRGGTEYYWDTQDHMTKVYDGSKTVQYKYDLFGRRVAKKVNSGDWKWYFYDGLKVIAEGTGTNSRTYYTNSPAVIGGIISRGGNEYYHYDRLGNVVATTTEYDGLISELYTMDAFGNLLQSGDNYYGYYQCTYLSQPYLLTTKEFDSDSGLYYFNARWYDPTTGRFISRPAPPAEKEHAYTFCWNNPLHFVDATGQCPECEDDIENDGGYCFATWCSNAYGISCYRQVSLRRSLLPIWCEHCCYDAERKLITSGEFAPHHDCLCASVVREPWEGTCIGEPVRYILHAFVDTLLHCSRYEPGI